VNDSHIHADDDLPANSFRSSERYQSEPFGAGRVVQTVIECAKRDAVAAFALKIQTAGELQGISRSQHVLEDEALRFRTQFRAQLYEDAGRKIDIESSNGAIALSDGERTFSLAAREC